MREICQRRCIDDLCRLGPTLCGQEFCEACGEACVFDQTVCDACLEKYEDFYDDGENDSIAQDGYA